VSDFGLKIGVEGEKELKKALSEINAQFKVLGSEMKLVSSHFDKNETSVESLTAKNEVLTKQIDNQKDKIEALRKALENASSSFGENDKRTQAWVIQLNNAQAELNAMERELKQNDEALGEVGIEFDNASKEADEFEKEIDKAGKEADASGGKFEKLGSIVKGVGAALGSIALAAGAAASRLQGGRTAVR
jgi:phage-related minor tail protein